VLDDAPALAIGRFSASWRPLRIQLGDPNSQATSSLLLEPCPRPSRGRKGTLFHPFHSIAKNPNMYLK
jgi:hypothetical protein